MLYNVKLIRKKVIATGTTEFFLEKPENFAFRAGQFCEITLIDPPATDGEGDTRAFSFTTAPFESVLAVATRIRDTAFKQNLEHLPDGTLVKLDGPFGDYTLHKTESKPAVFIIGGIGVTPVRSMIAQASHDHTAHHITLLHANRTLADAPFTEDFEALAKTNPNFTFVPVLGEAAEDWKGEHGRIDESCIRRHVPDVHTPMYYLSGPEGMVKAMRELLTGLDVNEDDIRTEEFAGY